MSFEPMFCLIVLLLLKSNQDLVVRTKKKKVFRWSTLSISMFFFSFIVFSFLLSFVLFLLLACIYYCMNDRVSVITYSPVPSPRCFVLPIYSLLPASRSLDA